MPFLCCFDMFVEDVGGRCRIMIGGGGVEDLGEGIVIAMLV